MDELSVDANFSSHELMTTDHTTRDKGKRRAVQPDIDLTDDSHSQSSDEPSVKRPHHSDSAAMPSGSRNGSAPMDLDVTPEFSQDLDTSVSDSSFVTAAADTAQSATDQGEEPSAEQRRKAKGKERASIPFDVDSSSPLPVASTSAAQPMTSTSLPPPTRPNRVIDLTDAASPERIDLDLLANVTPGRLPTGNHRRRRSSSVIVVREVPAPIIVDEIEDPPRLRPTPAVQAIPRDDDVVFTRAVPGATHMPPAPRQDHFRGTLPEPIREGIVQGRDYGEAEPRPRQRILVQVPEGNENHRYPFRTMQQAHARLQRLLGAGGLRDLIGLGPADFEIDERPPLAAAHREPAFNVAGNRGQHFEALGRPDPVQRGLEVLGAGLGNRQAAYAPHHHLAHAGRDGMHFRLIAPGMIHEHVHGRHPPPSFTMDKSHPKGISGAKGFSKDVIASPEIGIASTSKKGGILRSHVPVCASCLTPLMLDQPGSAGISSLPRPAMRKVERGKGAGRPWVLRCTHTVCSACLEAARARALIDPAAAITDNLSWQSPIAEEDKAKFNPRALARQRKADVEACDGVWDYWTRCPVRSCTAQGGRILEQGTADAPWELFV
ncbi:uncharacterized protein L969DRAFT_90272 [Mixia osmundae IAM 14324]|uniref:RING-type domain-containing protein n=1 Tax=Mixia osmundae (strain CBS 9802 / IAM 14324 / JCM 22182 / KY 12970) TaxID=764103 RepID=G7DZM9_MIXOS|nr:uncharacterized protein L969DRAFT_90272 [Mixia osmundae IAM 14324]KEI37201.1 hypothetical protein L969DRAFT_90272 [Mixia osmundae IAM 14324]GAA96039.1 hypothetical protein E5Q_02699 [Mixia osmundae IAM 14324]